MTKTVDYTKVGEQMSKASAQTHPKHNTHTESTPSSASSFSPSIANIAKLVKSYKEAEALNPKTPAKKPFPTKVIVALVIGGFFFWPLFIVAYVIYALNKDKLKINLENKAEIKEAIEKFKNDAEKAYKKEFGEQEKRN